MRKGMKIWKKLILTFILVTLISSVSGIVGFVILTGMNQKYAAALVDYGFAEGDIGRFNAEFNNNCALFRDIIVQSDNAGIQASKQQLDESTSKLNQYFAKMKPGMVTNDEKKYYDTIKKYLDEYTVDRNQVVQLGIVNNDAQASDLASQECIPVSNEIENEVDKLIKEKTAAGNQTSAELSQQGLIARETILCVIVFAILLSILIAALISRGISRPVSKLLKAADRIAEGDLSVQVDVGSQNEIGQLGAAFSRTIASLNQYITDIKAKLSSVEKGDLTVARSFEYKGDFVQLIDSIEAIVRFMNQTVTKMRQASRQVASGSEQVSSGAQALAQGATEQASSIEELSGTITEITAQIEKNSEHAEKANTNVRSVMSEVETCNHHMQRMVEAMSQISDSSSRIRKIIKTIQDISFQTNILALNAAVEAARAGSAGKGFAVVADEVRNLASKSASAAKDTALLIQDSIKEVENGTKIAGETAQSLLRVVKNAESVSETVEDISKATTKQADRIQRIHGMMEQISGVVQTTSATAQESAAASEELSGQARNMRNLLSGLKLRDAV